ncbi:MAG: type VI secretion system baseplate subunit TssF [Burkholderiaceae bacterium]|jgi:type VI secretion system protein ImpG|uniref:Type VI secretion system baseplate subunit TssF n=1 Tax=Cupriavidus metallidurans TaxID=119219 RepID=A0A482IPM6_9BURK|nr:MULTISPECIES: type VI secretion system baseplate subunit TssF [Cupriavidus]KWR81247.1 type VI secretion protein ImpG [Cupriavidus sp. SHE]PCH58566.1 MAG: type VI secretion system baseplate subunit TssF [Burkholderiaceae bacterium]QBP08820.1 type VI secretion system baseplate subunit TssF [Cupriavidus metallidurans]QWC89238.1 type VI secretion system baseplate subunit TssF [Cupriavidus metallidurans]
MNHPTQDNEILRYYEAEMRYLREAGKEFAQAFPDRARMLNIDRIGERDPHVERLFEGFAFLMGRLRHKLDDELPELTEGLVSMLWPHYLRMIPSLSILELTPNDGALQRHETLPAGLEVVSDSIALATQGGSEGHVECTYRTTQPVDLYPLRLTEANAYARENGRSVIRLRLALQTQGRREQLAVPRLRLYLHADRPLALALYSALTAEPLAMQVRVPGYPVDRPGAPQPMAGVRLEPAGFAAEERLWPKADNAFGGYQLLLEYFTFPEKFMFVDLVGLDLDAIPEGVEHFDVEVVLNRPFPDDMRFSADNVRLFCTPIINLFELEADPITITHFETEYRVRAMEQHGQHVEPYSVETVRGFETGSGKRFEYAPFAAFRHRGGMLRHEMPERYFHTRVRRGPSGRFDTWVVLGGHAWDHQQFLPEETLSLSVTGTNGMLPRKGLREAGITRTSGGFTHIGTVRNLTAPTLPVYPPSGDRFHWRVLSHLAPNYLSLLDAEVLRGSLALYDWTDGELNRRRIEAITDVRHRPLQKLVKGGLLRGVEIEVLLDSTRFAGEGDVELFGEMLNRFLSLYATVNLYTRLVIVSQPSGKRQVWPDSKGEGAPF